MKNNIKLEVLNSVRDRRELLHIAIASACVAACGDVSMEDGGVRNDVPVRPDSGVAPVDVPNGMDVPNPPTDTGGSCAPAGFQRVGAVASFPVGMFTFRAASHYFVGRDAMGLYALTSVCTHRQCDVAPTPRGTFLCPCHAAAYDANGAVTGGPAPMPLEHFALMVCGGDVYVNPLMTVPPTTRTMP